MKITKFRDIPQFTRDGNWQCDFDIKYIVKWVNEQISESGLQLNPNFQRGHVWAEQQQIAFLEYFFKGGKSGTVIYFNKPDWHGRVKDGSYNEYVCVDGLQRITAIYKFVNNEIPIFGTFFKEFEDQPRMKYTMKINVNDLKTEEEVLQWYVDMNAGGTPHTKDEIEKVKEMIEHLQIKE
jgi:uncharacterized protein with ParB-like and HNH nuclease domain